MKKYVAALTILDDSNHETLCLLDNECRITKCKKEYENTIFSNIHYIIANTGEESIVVGIQVNVGNNADVYMLGSRVRVTPDQAGYICPTIKKPGYGRIVEVRYNDTDHFFGVQMDDGSYGYVKYARLL